MTRRSACLLIALLGYAAAADAQTAGVATPSVYDRIWKFTELYRNDSNRVIQRVRFSGRFQQDYATVDADEGNASEWNIRRMRLGLRATFFQTLTLHGEADLNPQESDPFYVRLTDFYLRWNARDQLALTVGKQSVPFMLDGATSSKELLTVDRSNLTNNIWFTQEYLTGVSVSGSASPWAYHLGLYSAGERNREFGEFTGGAVALATVARDFAMSSGAKETLLTLNYVYQNPDPDNTFTQPLQHIVSLNFRFETDRWGFRSDVSAAAGYFDQSDVRGLVAMPFVNVTRALQFVGRYTLVESRDPNGIELGTYEDRVVSGRGDRYNEWYLGANYYLYGHQLKLQSGIQFGDMQDLAADGGAYSGVSWTAGLRIGW